MTVRQATFQMFERYYKLLEKKKDFGSGSKLPETSYSHLRGMCSLAMTNIDIWSIDKLSRWLGYVQGILIFMGDLRINEERDFSRPLFHAAYKSEGIDIPEIQNAIPIRD